MRIEKQNFSLPVKNHDDDDVSGAFHKHGRLFPGACKRALVVGPSGCGKTNVVVSLLEAPTGLRFENVYIYSKSLQQPKYERLREVFRPIEEIGYYECDDGREIVPPDRIAPNSVIIFDDVITSDQNVIRDYFSFGRHTCTDCFYLAQTYAAIPKHLIRDNASLIILFQQDNLNLKHIYDDHVNVDMPFSKFKELCSVCWKTPFGFLVIDKESPLSNGRYRQGFDKFIFLE